ncbi:MAG: hypothetical protein N0C84_01245 [Candidatus Thiodiazotropha taylori]|uniref:Uncharacterized protein n=1 Tax=Candidatus Thiodiazotropha taylori TaxID=2792791 RepID=A0A9E4K9K8_9GAMM|nr:hypothetical protein [Candidatus Thiodiazotropha taylori]MCW4255072.1 hypothetical protein [Candidatus Thiodiazotropha taylori]
MSLLTGNNPFQKLFENDIELKINGQKQDGEKKDEDPSAPAGAEGESKKDGNVEIPPGAPDANGDGEVNAADDLDGNGIVDAKDLKIAELQKELQVRQLEKEIETLDDPAWDPQQMVVNRLRIKDKGDRFVCINQRGDEIESFPYDNKQTTSKEARYEAQRFVERHMDDQINTKHKETKESEAKAEMDAENPNDPNAPGGGDPTPGKGTEAGSEGEEAKQKANAPDPKKKPTVKEGMDIFERRKFIYAARIAKEAGKDTFEFAGKIHNVKTGKVMVDEEVQIMVNQIKEWMHAGMQLEDAVNRLINEAGYNNFPLTREEWLQRLPMLAKNMSDVANGNSKGTSTAQYVTLTNRINERALLEGKVDKNTMKMLKSLDADEARLIIQGLPKNVRAKVMKQLGLKEKVDGRTKAYKETANRILARKQRGNTEDLEEGMTAPVLKNVLSKFEIAGKELDTLSKFIKLDDPKAVRPITEIKKDYDKLMKKLSSIRKVLSEDVQIDLEESAATLAIIRGMKKKVDELVKVFRGRGQFEKLVGKAAGNVEDEVANLRTAASRMSDILGELDTVVLMSESIDEMMLEAKLSPQQRDGLEDLIFGLKMETDPNGMGKISNIEKLLKQAKTEYGDKIHSDLKRAVQTGVWHFPKWGIARGTYGTDRLAAKQQTTIKKNGKIDRRSAQSTKRDIKYSLRGMGRKDPKRLGEEIDLLREFASDYASYLLEKDEKSPKEDPKAKEAGGDDAGEQAALKALEDAKAALKKDYGYSDDDLGGTPAKSGDNGDAGANDESGGGDEAKAAPKQSAKDDDEKPEKGADKGDAPKAAPKNDKGAGGEKGAPEAEGEEEMKPKGGEEKQAKADKKEAGADAKEQEMATPEGDDGMVPDEDGDGVEDINNDGMNDAGEIEDAEDEAAQGEIAAKLDQLQMAVDQILADQQEGDMEEPQVRKGVGPSGKEEYDVVQGDKTLANGFASAEEALTWIERNRDTVMGPPEGEMGATEGEEDMVAGDGKMVGAVKGTSTKPIPGKEPTPNDGKITPSKPDEKKPVDTKDKKPTVAEMYAAYISGTTPETSMLSEAWYGTRKAKTSKPVKKSKVSDKDNQLSARIQAHQKANPGVGTARSRMIAKGYIKADIDDYEQMTRESNAVVFQEKPLEKMDEVEYVQVESDDLIDEISQGLKQRYRDRASQAGVAAQNMSRHLRGKEKQDMERMAKNRRDGVKRSMREDQQPTVAEIYAAAMDRFTPKK